MPNGEANIPRIGAIACSINGVTVAYLNPLSMIPNPINRTIAPDTDCVPSTNALVNCCPGFLILAKITNHTIPMMIAISAGNDIPIIVHVNTIATGMIGAKYANGLMFAVPSAFTHQSPPFLFPQFLTANFLDWK